MFQLQHLLHGIDSLRTTHIIFIGKISIHIIIQFNFLSIKECANRYFDVVVMVVFIKTPLYWHGNEFANSSLELEKVLESLTSIPLVLG